MTIRFHCDGEGCTAEAAPGTTTGGLPCQWTCDYERDGRTNLTKRVLHYCEKCGVTKPEPLKRRRVAPPKTQRRTKKPPKKQGRLFK